VTAVCTGVRTAVLSDNSIAAAVIILIRRGRKKGEKGDEEEGIIAQTRL
jgi:hypothetical protein